MQAQNFQNMAIYNQWMNEKLYNCAKRLDTDALNKDMGAFFGSIIGTLNHLIVADIIWLRRFAKHPAKFTALKSLLEIQQPASLDQVITKDLDHLEKQRKELDETILGFADELNEENLNQRFSYQNMKGEQFNDRLGYPLQHFFNHQTHHRGQLTTLFNQLDVDVGVTDLLMTIRSLELE